MYKRGRLNVFCRVHEYWSWLLVADKWTLFLTKHISKNRKRIIVMIASQKGNQYLISLKHQTGGYLIFLAWPKIISPQITTIVASIIIDRYWFYDLFHWEAILFYCSYTHTEPLFIKKSIDKMKYEWYVHKCQEFVSSGNMFTKHFRSGNNVPEKFKFT